MSTEDGAPGVGSRWRVPLTRSVLTITNVTPTAGDSGTMDVFFTSVRAGSGAVFASWPLDYWKDWVAAGRVVKLKEEADAG